MNFKIKFKIIIFFLTFTQIFYGFSQIPLSFYGVISKDADKNMINMTEDMFFKQISEIKPNTIDLRLLKEDLEASFSRENTDELKTFFNKIPNKSVIFINILKSDELSEKWKCIIYLKLQNENLKTFEKEYDSYYKILMESKYFLQEIFNSEKKDSTSSSIKQKIEKNITNILTTEILSGTWTGEKFVNKIILMRGGRGFIIFTNGASMNISVSIKEQNKVFIKQTSSQNASFFPELPRKTALEIATFAKPIEYNLTYNSDGTLSGKKTTILLDSSGNLSDSFIDVKWTKKDF